MKRCYCLLVVCALMFGPDRPGCAASFTVRAPRGLPLHIDALLRRPFRLLGRLVCGVTFAATGYYAGKN
ncbi:MAG: hypothetical protein ACYTG0_40090, partial [Planctomycetota bacterium]